MSFNNSYGEELGKGRASWAVPGAAAALLALLQGCTAHPTCPLLWPSCAGGRTVWGLEPAGEVRLLGQGPVPSGWRPGASSLRAPSPAQWGQ